MTPPPAAPLRSQKWSRKAATVAAFCALTIGLSGFFMGLRQSHRATAELRQQNAADTAPADLLATFPTAPRYHELAGGLLHPNREWVNRLEALRPAEALLDPLPLTAAEQNAVRAKRVSRRQYDGAPPITPHPIDQSSPAACLSCHGKPTVIAGAPVPLMSHAAFANCLQCHAAGSGPTSTWIGRPMGTLADDNGFHGKVSSSHGDRAYPGAPPVIPHPTFMRESCLSCHRPGGSSAFKTTHPRRDSCLQCHAMNAALDGHPGLGQTPPPLKTR